MPCEPVRLPGGGFAIACSRGRRSRPRCYQCGKPAAWLCDFATGANKTCDRPICADHGEAQPGNRDYCRDHALLAMEARAK